MSASSDTVTYSTLLPDGAAQPPSTAVVAIEAARLPNVRRFTRAMLGVAGGESGRGQEGGAAQLKPLPDCGPFS